MSTDAAIRGCQVLVGALVIGCGGAEHFEHVPAVPPPPSPNVRVDEKFVVALDLSALRATAFGAKVLRSLSKSQASSNERIGFSPLEEASWITTAGPELSMLSTGHIAIVAHTKSDAEVNAMFAKAGGVGGDVSLYGARGVLTKRPGMILFAPDGATPSLDPRRGDEALHIHVKKLVQSWWPKDGGEIDIKGRIHDGFDLEGTLACPNADRCQSIAADFRKRIKSFDEQARGVTHDAFVPLESESNLSASDSAVNAKLHLDAEQLRILTDLALAYFGLP